MTITALPTAPNRNMTPEAFIAAADAWVAALATFVTQANADLNLILNLSGLLATSTSSVLIGTGAKSLTVETSKAFLPTQSVRVYSTASPANYMLGTVTSYDAGTGALVVSVASVGGSGTLAAWTVVLAASGEWLGNATTATAATTAATATSVTGSAVVSGALGHATGAGGSVTQVTSITTGVTLNTQCGKIRTVSHSFVSGTAVEIPFTNTELGVTDLLKLSWLGGDILAGSGPALLTTHVNSGTGVRSIVIYPIFTSSSPMVADIIFSVEKGVVS